MKRLDRVEISALPDRVVRVSVQDSALVRIESACQLIKHAIKQAGEQALEHLFNLYGASVKKALVSRMQNETCMTPWAPSVPAMLLQVSILVRLTLFLRLRETKASANRHLAAPAAAAKHRETSSRAL